LLLNKTTGLHSILSVSARSKLKLLLLIIISIFFCASCGDKKEDAQKPNFYIRDSSMVYIEAKKIFGDQLKTILIGNFDTDTLLEAIAGIEITGNNQWGIKFFLLEEETNSLIKKYETELLDGSFKEALWRKINFPNYNYDLIYYNSEDYFLGSGGGEVFAYVLDFNTHSTYYAHLFSEAREPVKLFLSENISDKEIRKFYVSRFKKDYPDVQLSSEDVSLEF
jgi:hypothetical protein